MYKDCETNYATHADKDDILRAVSLLKNLYKKKKKSNEIDEQRFHNFLKDISESVNKKHPNIFSELLNITHLVHKEKSKPTVVKTVEEIKSKEKSEKPVEENTENEEEKSTPLENVAATNEPKPTQVPQLNSGIPTDTDEIPSAQNNSKSDSKEDQNNEEDVDISTSWTKEQQKRFKQILNLDEACLVIQFFSWMNGSG